jgi:hypothetical protein
MRRSTRCNLRATGNGITFADAGEMVNILITFVAGTIPPGGCSPFGQQSIAVAQV